MNFLNKIYAWILKNYIKVISFLLIIGLAYGAYLYYFKERVRFSDNILDSALARKTCRILLFSGFVCFSLAIRWFFVFK